MNADNGTVANTTQIHHPYSTGEERCTRRDALRAVLVLMCSDDDDIGTRLPNLIRLLAVPSPAQHISSWFEPRRDSNIVDNLQVGHGDVGPDTVR